jgi:hypothetical protein
MKDSIQLKVPASEVFAVLRFPATKFTRSRLHPKVFAALNKLAFQRWSMKK